MALLQSAHELLSYGELHEALSALAMIQPAVCSKHVHAVLVNLASRIDCLEAKVEAIRDGKTWRDER